MTEQPEPSAASESGEADGALPEPPEITATPEPPESPSPLVRRRRGRRPLVQTENTGPGEEWMLTYMDTVTLLVTLFVMILSFANFEKPTFEHFKQAISIGLDGGGILSGAWGLQPGAPKKIPNPLVEALNSQSREIDPDTSPDLDTPGTRDAVQEALENSGLSDDVKMTLSRSAIHFEINAGVLFASGEAKLSNAGLDLLTKLAPIFAAAPLNVDIEGHTDNVPIQNENFSSNWELSGARAAAVAEHLVGEKVPPQRIRIVGYADTQPLDDNSIEAGRKRNRRVNLTVKFQTTDGLGEWISKLRP